MWVVLKIALFVSCLSILFVMRSCPGAFPFFSLLIIYLISFGVKCLRGVEVGRVLINDWLILFKWLIGGLMLLGLNTS
jgi:hypothetical protein